MPRYRSFVVSVAAIALLGGAAACGSSTSSGNTGTSGSGSGTTGAKTVNSALCGPTKGSGNIKIGAFNFAESDVIAEIYSAALKECGYTTSVRQLGSREVVYPALKSGDLNLVPEYAATLTDFINNQQNGANAPSKASGDINETMTALRTELPSTLSALDPAPATDKNAFAVKSSFAQAHHLTTLSQLGTYSKTHPLKLGGPPECPTRPFCEPGLKKTYGMKFSSFKALDAGGPLTIKGLTSGKIDVGLVFTSDPTVQSSGLTVLTDDKNLQASDNIVPIVTKSDASGALVKALDAVDQKLTQDTLIQLNKAVQVQHAQAGQVATQFLQQVGLGS